MYAVQILPFAWHKLNSPRSFRQKFKSFIDQYDLRELQFQSLLRTKELEIQYYLARYEQQKKAQQQEADKSRQLTTQVTTFASTETELRNQLNIYVEKFKQVRNPRITVTWSFRPSFIRSCKFNTT